MRVPLSWLSDYVPITLPPRELAERLTMSGSLVERIEQTAEQLAAIVVARVERLERHPDSDHLWLATLDLGGRSQRVVTGAPNLFEGAIVPFIVVGQRLPGQEKPLEARKLRGITSEGMVCSAQELGLGEDHSGIMILNEIVEARGIEDPVGMSLGEIFGETVLELEITPNRPDCLAIYGVAREVAAVTGVALRPVPETLREATPPAAGLASARIEAPDLCARCTARVITGVTIGPSPAWLAERLQAAGMRPINNVVDVTNYVMLELGQPLHAYDLDLLAGAEIVVRRARDGERLTTLDGVERMLNPDMLVIADANGPVGVAGVMGGGNTEVHAGTTRILLEAATFNPRSIRRTSLALGLRSEASSRFEKGLPTPLAALGSNRAAALIAELGGGTVAEGLIDAGTAVPEPRRIRFPIAEVARLLGMDLPVERIVANLQALGFSCEPEDADHLLITCPWWRQDIDGTADIVEEIARVTGFDAIPETLLRGSVPARPTSAHQRWYAPARRVLLACGLSEGSSPGLAAIRDLELLRPEGAGEDWLAEVVPHPEAVREANARFEPVRVVNPLTPEREILRPTLLPGLLAALRDNLRAGEDHAAFFEIDFCAFARPGTLPLERRTLALALAGDRVPRSWADPTEPFDFYDLKGSVEAFLSALGLRETRIMPGAHPLLHPGRAALLQLDGTVVGFLGEVHPILAERWDLAPRRAYIAEFDFEALAERAVATRQFVDFPRVPVAKRDLAVVVDDATPAETVLTVIREAGKKLLTRVTLFDVYRGDQIPPGTKSIALSVAFQSPERTLSDADAQSLRERIVSALADRFGAELRA